MDDIANLIYEKITGDKDITSRIKLKNKDYKLKNERLKTIKNQLFSHMQQEDKEVFMEYDDVINYLFSAELREYFITGFNCKMTS